MSVRAKYRRALCSFWRSSWTVLDIAPDNGRLGPMQSSTALRARRIDATLEDVFPDARCELNFSTPLELTVATILSAQCTDARVNQVTPELFARYPNAAAYAAAVEEDIAQIIRPTGLFRSKAHHLVGMGHELMRNFDGQIPRGLTELTSLPGVGRKTALVVRGNAFGLPALAVDTHVARVARRLGLSAGTTPLAVEKDLCAQVAPQRWTGLSHRLIFLGRRFCRARRPDCAHCPVAAQCATAQGAAEQGAAVQRATAQGAQENQAAGQPAARQSSGGQR